MTTPAAGTPVWVWAEGEWRPGRLLDYGRQVARVRYLDQLGQPATADIPDRHLWPSLRAELVPVLDTPPAGPGQGQPDTRPSTDREGDR